MERKLIFSARYPIPSVIDHRSDPLIDPEKWLTEFLCSEEERDVLADRLIEMARYVSESQELAMDIYDSPLMVWINLYLDETLYFGEDTRMIAALLFVCGQLATCTRQSGAYAICLSMIYDREAM